MGKAARRPGRDRPRPRPGVVPRGLRPRARPPAGGGPVPVMAGGVPAFIEAAAVDPGFPSRAGAPRRCSTRSSRPRASRRPRTTPARGASSSSTPPTASRRWRDGMGARWRADLEGDGVAAARIDELVDASHAKLTGAPALVLGCLTWDGLDRYPDEPVSAPSGAWRCCRSAPRSRTSCSRRPTAGLASCWVAAPIFCPEARARRARPPEPSGSRTRWSSSATPIPRTRPGHARCPPRRAPRLRLIASDGAGAIRRVGRNHARACAPSPSSRSVHGSQPRCDRRAGPGVERRALRARPGAGGRVAAAGSSKAGELAPSCRNRSLHARLDAGADVEHEPAAPVDGAHERVDDVVDVDEVARLLAVAEDRRTLAARAAWPAKIATTPASPCGSWRGPYTLASASTVYSRPLDLAVVVQVVADRLLRHAVRRQRVLRVALAHGQLARARRRACRRSPRTRPCARPPRARPRRR